MFETPLTPEKDVSLEIGSHTVQTGKIFNGFVPGRYRETDPIPVLDAIRRGLADLPENKTTFKLSQIPHGLDEINDIHPTMLDLCGVWIHNNRGNKSGSTVYVHPDRDDAWLYADVFPICKCGATVTALKEGVSDAKERYPGRTDHADDCRMIWRQRARMELSENRREAIIHHIRTGGNCRYMGPRLGYPYDKHRSTPHDVDYDEHHEWYRERLAHTAAAHLPYHSPPEIATAFGYGTKEAVVNAINDYLDVDFYEMRGYRQRAEPIELPNVCNIHHQCQTKTSKIYPSGHA